MATITELTDAVVDLVGRRELTQQAYEDWLGGAANGGPNQDGRYPLSDSTGHTRLVPSPARLTEYFADAAIYTFPDEFDPLAGSGTGHDDAPAIQAMFAQQLIDGRRPALRPSKRYYCGDTITIDPSRNSLEGNHGIFDFRLKTFIDPDSLPELTTNGRFDAGGTGWTSSIAQTYPSVYTDGQMRYDPPQGPQNFLEFGQRIIAPAGTTLRIRMDIESIKTLQVTFNTFRSIAVSLRRDLGLVADSLVAGANVGTVTQTIVAPGSPAVGAYTPIGVVEWTVTTNEANPVLRVQTNAGVIINSISCRVVPNNSCVIMRVRPSAEGGQIRGHNYREFRNFKIAGKSGSEAGFVDAVYFDTPAVGTQTSFHSRTNFYNVDISDSVARGLVMNNQTYLNNFYSCRIVTSKRCVETIPGSQDAGENIVFFGGNMGGGEIGIYNPAGFAIRLMGTSIDFTRQWFVGRSLLAIGAWFETNATMYDRPLFDVEGSVLLQGCLFQVDGTPTQPPGSPFHVGDNGHLVIRDAYHAYMLVGSTQALCTGGGKFEFQQGPGLVRGGSRNIELINKRDQDHNVLGPEGYFEQDQVPSCVFVIPKENQERAIDRNTVYEPSVGIFTGTVATGSRVVLNVTPSPNATALAGRRKIDSVNVPSGSYIDYYQPAGTFTGTLTLGSDVITQVNPLPTGPAINNLYVSGPGIPHGAKVRSYSYANATITLDTSATVTGPVSFSTGDIVLLSQAWNGPTTTGQAISHVRDPSALGGVRTSNALAYTGTRSLELYKDLPNAASVTAHIALPLVPNRSFGSELRWAVPADPAFAAGVNGTLYFRAFLGRVTGLEGSSPTMAETRQYLSDLPKTSIPMNTGTAGWTDIRDTQSGTGLWRRLTASLNSFGEGQHNGFAPEWASHFIWEISLVSMPTGARVYIDAVHGNPQ